VLPLPGKHLQGDGAVPTGPLERPDRALPIDHPGPQGEVEVIGAAPVVRHVHVGEAVGERREERLRAIALTGSETEVGVAHVEMEAGLGSPIEDRPERVHVGEGPVVVLHHEGDPPVGRVVGQLANRRGVERNHPIARVQGHALIGVHVDQPHAGLREDVERPQIERTGGLAQLAEGRRNRQVPGGVTHGPEAEVSQQPADLRPVLIPRRRGLEGEVDEIEPIFGDAMDLLDHGPTGEVHGADQHGPIVALTLEAVETFDAIMTRRSVPRVGDRVPDNATIKKLLDAAVRAPTHHLTEPWRFIVLRGDARHGLGAAWAAGVERSGKNPDGVVAKALRAPAIICVVGRPKTHLPKVVELEEHHAIGAAIQNILLAAHALGLGAMMRTGPAASLEEVRDFLGLEATEIIAGFVYLGYPLDGREGRPLTRRADASTLTEWRDS
jgi:nitroreductase